MVSGGPIRISEFDRLNLASGSGRMSYKLKSIHEHKETAGEYRDTNDQCHW
jgi:hypothetical protein